VRRRKKSAVAVPVVPEKEMKTTATTHYHR
jgi:hypothetical protein